ncbi:MAG: RNA polymerase sigma factor [Spirochaetaceae bacterium]|jgi:RNA polymerase sigma-70 factor (ECF subfamily)|nr:RNA polymerase sigma factor [Spirochaetaceae bacterium]
MNEGYFKAIYESCYQVLYRVAFGITRNSEAAEDLCQEAFIKLYQKNMSFPNQDEARFWLIRVVKNASLNYAKRKEREKNAYQRSFHEAPVYSYSGAEILEKQEDAVSVKEALEKLPEKLRIVIILKEYGELNYKEIGRALGISEGNVKVRAYRARERLIKLMKEFDNTNKEGR